MAGKTSPLAHHKPIYAVGAVAYRYDTRGRLQILLIRKRNGYWTLPKGRVHPTEDDTSALLRELREETGLTGVVEEEVARVQYITPRRRLPRRKVVTYYLVRIAPDAVAIPGAHHGEVIEQIRWASPRRALRRVKRKRIRDIIVCAEALLRERNQTGATGSQ
ncbi:MAG: NUDIX domain-containing protein [Roseiflexus sp.]|nr:NUDIX domain-containing protein [Roseiflexus sp.]MCS7289445.1 NUDIX domain-containing protein [Roseiflexus sp.]MDW8144911.1 NUDIX domain-containing protein [Roseiflexaceae bacterium]MDW8233659.1 NUDIX domain-containing protein [Roseiflexaceae bacterium]